MIDALEMVLARGYVDGNAIFHFGCERPHTRNVLVAYVKNHDILLSAGRTGLCII